MDFTFTEEQETIAKLARDLFERRATPEHLTELEAGDIRYDDALWKELAAVDLLGTALPESVGGNGGGFVELGVLLAEVGWSVAPVPVYATLVLGADPIARHGNSEQQQRILPGVVSGQRILTAGLAEPGRSDPTVPATTARRDGAGWRLDGAKELVPAAQLADTILIPATTEDGDVGPVPARRGRRGRRGPPGEDHQPRTARRRIPGRCNGFRRGQAARRARADRVAAHPRAGRAVRDPARRGRAGLADGRRIHHAA